jgi:hypothetical protein
MEAKEDFHLDADHIYRAVALALELAQKPSLQAVSLPNAPEGSVFEVPLLAGSWGRALKGLEHPFTGKRRPITFDFDVAKGRDDVVLAHLNHKLVQMSLRLLREELWSLEDVKKLHRVDVRLVEDENLEEPVACVWSRLVVTGGTHTTLHEEITLSGGWLRDRGYARIREIGKLESLVDIAKSFEVDDETFGLLGDRFEVSREAVTKSMEARSRERIEYIHSTLDRRKEREEHDILETLDELEHTIRKELGDIGTHKQLTFDFAEDEREQLKKDESALRRRLERIPDERIREAETIERRYDNRQHRTFPVAVTFLVPKTFAKGGRS